MSTTAYNKLVRTLAIALGGLAGFYLGWNYHWPGMLAALPLGMAIGLLMGRLLRNEKD
jgi:hypothetical protein